MSCGNNKVVKGQTVEVLGRIIGWNGQPIVPSDIASISYSAYILEQATGDENAVDTFQDVELDPVEDFLEETLLLNDVKWHEDSIGYNFHFMPDPGIFTQRGEIYLLRVTLVSIDPGEIPDLVGVWLFEVD